MCFFAFGWKLKIRIDAYVRSQVCRNVLLEREVGLDQAVWHMRSGFFSQVLVDVLSGMEVLSW